MRTNKVPAFIWKFIIVMGLLSSILYYGVDLTVSQSVVLSILITWLILRVGGKVAKPTFRFTPYYICVTPKWLELLTDFKLIEKPEDWYALVHSFDSVPFKEYRPFRNHMYFVIVHQSDDLERMLIYSHRQSFVSEVDFDEYLDPLKLTKLIGGYEHEYHVSFFMKHGPNGYDLGIIVPDWWWDEAKGSCPKTAKEDIDHLTGQVKLVLSTLPYSDFQEYWAPVEWNKSYEKQLKKILNWKEDRRSNFGWRVIDQRGNSELQISWPDSIENKYFTVEHHAV